MRSMQRFSDKLAILGELDPKNPPAMRYRRIGAPLLFDRLWRELGIDKVTCAIGMHGYFSSHFTEIEIKYLWIF